MIVIEYEEVTDKWHWDRWKMLMERIGSVSVEGKRQFRWNRTGSKPASEQPQKVQQMSKGQGSPIDCTERSGFKHKFDSVHTSQAFSLSILIARSHETDLWKCPISCFNPFFLFSFFFQQTELRRRQCVHHSWQRQRVARVHYWPPKGRNLRGRIRVSRMFRKRRQSNLLDILLHLRGTHADKKIF